MKCIKSEHGTISDSVEEGSASELETSVAESVEASDDQEWESF